MVRLKVMFKTQEEMDWFIDILGGSVIKISRIYPSKNGFSRVHIDVKTACTNVEKPI